jgi:hypothetical protein
MPREMRATRCDVRRASGVWVIGGSSHDGATCLFMRRSIFFDDLRDWPFQRFLTTCSIRPSRREWSQYPIARSDRLPLQCHALP